MARNLLRPMFLSLGLLVAGALSAGLVATGLLLASPQSASADAVPERSAAGEDAAESRASSFVAVEGAVEEDIAGGPLMLGAYAATWILLFLYVLRLVSLQQRTLREVEQLKAELKGARDKG